MAASEVPIPDKAEWQKLKAKYKIPPKVGDNSKVGEHLDAIHKAAADSWFKTVPPCQAALKALEKFDAAIKAAKDANLAKFLPVVDKEVDQKIKDHIARVNSLRQQILDAPKMAAKCGEVLNSADPKKEKLEILLKKIVQIQQLLSAIQTSVDVMKNAGASGDWDKITTFIRDVKKKINDLDLLCDMQKKKPMSLDMFEDHWDKRAKQAGPLCKTISKMLTEEMKL